jgi:uncharacterized protein YjiS (DUF1127 family)
MNHARFSMTHFNVSRHARPGILARLARAYRRWRALRGFFKGRGSKW